MARRRAAFGRLPKAAPDLTNAIVALVREAQAQTDSNFVDAWKNGGKVEGKGVDDDRLLSHLKERRDQLSPEDPGWDEWNDNYIQYDFAINESKMALKNDEGKVSDAEMANFYRKWAGREDVQKNSEFYRTLLSNAAKWNASAKARSAGNGARAAAEAHQNWVNGYYKDNVQGAETATKKYLLPIAKTYGAAPPGATSLDDINPDSTGYARFLDVLDGHSDDPNVQGLLDEMVTEIKKTNPNFKMSESNLNDLIDRGDRGLKKLEGNATNDTERKEWAGRRADLRYEKTRIRQAAVNERIQIAGDTYRGDILRCNGDPYCQRNVTQTFRDKLQGEVKNVVAGSTGTAAGGLAIDVSTQDTKTASALLNTIRKLDAGLNGNELKPTPAAELGKATDSSGHPDYDIFDAAAGNGSAGASLDRGLNSINHDRQLLDEGGWVATVPATDSQTGAPLYDGNNQPIYNYTVYAANMPTPPGYVAVPGTTMVTDTTRSTAGPYGHTPVSVTPTTYVAPSAPNIQYVDPGGVSLTGDTASGVKMFDGKTEAGAPWTELRGVKGPDGTARTLYRTGDGTAAAPYLYHDQPPVPQGVKPNAAGQYVVPVSLDTTDPKKPFLKADITELAGGVKMGRATVGKSGNFVFGTFSSPGATATSQAIAGLYAVPGNKDANNKANEFLSQFQKSIEALPPTKVNSAGQEVINPERLAGRRDFTALASAVTLYATGKAGSAVGDAVNEANKNGRNGNGYVDSLARQGFTADRWGQAEVDRRVAMLAGIDDANDRIAARVSVMDANKAGLLNQGMTNLANSRLSGDARNAAQGELSDLQKARQDVFNPAISVSAIKVPGMPQQFASQGGLVATTMRGINGEVIPTLGTNPRTPFLAPVVAPPPSDVKPPTAPPAATTNLTTPPPPVAVPSVSTQQAAVGNVPKTTTPGVTGTVKVPGVGRTFKSNDPNDWTRY